MAPKKAVQAAAAEPVASVPEMEEAPAASASEAKPKVGGTKAKSAKPTKLVNLGHPTTMSMVVEVLKKNPERKGTSVQAIRSKILVAHPTVDPVRLKSLLRSALNKGLEKGILVRPPNSSSTGATGRFKLAKPLPKSKEVSGSKENTDPDAKPKSKPKKKVAKPAAGEESQGEKPEKKAKAAPKKEKSSEEKTKASTKDAEEKPQGPAAAKKPKAKKASTDGASKPKKESAKKEKTESEGSTGKTSKKGKK